MKRRASAPVLDARSLPARSTKFSVEKYAACAMLWSYEKLSLRCGSMASSRGRLSIVRRTTRWDRLLCWFIPVSATCRRGGQRGRNVAHRRTWSGLGLQSARRAGAWYEQRKLGCQWFSGTSSASSCVPTLISHPHRAARLGLGEQLSQMASRHDRLLVESFDNGPALWVVHDSEV